MGPGRRGLGPERANNSSSGKVSIRLPQPPLMSEAIFTSQLDAAKGGKVARRRRKAKGRRRHRDVKPHEAIVKGLSHPLRVEALAILSQRIASPTEIAKQLDVELRNLSYHIRILEELGLIEIVKEEPVRGAMAHYYKAVDRLRLDSPACKNLGYDVRKVASGHLLEALVTDATASLAAGMCGRPLKQHVSRTPLFLDEHGWKRVNEIQETALKDVLKEQAAALERMNGSRDGRIRVVLGMFCFELPLDREEK